MAKSKSTLNLVSQTAASSPAAPSSSASSRPGMLRAPSQQGSNFTAQRAGKPATGGSNQNDAASSSQVWLTDAKIEQTCEETRSCKNEPGSEFSTTCTEICRRKFRNQRRGRFEVAAQIPHASRFNVPHRERRLLDLCDNKLKRKPEDKLEDLNEKTMIWRTFMIGHPNKPQFILETIILDSSHSTKNQSERTSEIIVRCNQEVGQRAQTEIQGTCFHRFTGKKHSWKMTTLLTGQAIRLSTATSPSYSPIQYCAWEEST